MLSTSLRGPSGLAAAPASRAVACRPSLQTRPGGFHGCGVLGACGPCPASGRALVPRPVACSAASPVPPRGSASSGSGSYRPEYRGGPAGTSSSGSSRLEYRGGAGGRSGAGRGGAPSRGRGSQRPPLETDPDDPASAKPLEQLAGLVKTFLPDWKTAGNKMRLTKAMNRAVKLSSEKEVLNPSAGESVAGLCHSIFADLAAAYLQLVPQLLTFADCIIPLYACSEAGYWGPASASGKGGLAVALLQRLSEKDCALLRPRKAGGQTFISRGPPKPSKADQDHANLWRALAAAPQDVRSCVDSRGLLEANAEGIYSLESIATQACSNILLACSRLQLKGFDRLAHHLTARLVEMGARANSQDLANSLYALGELAEDVGHRPRPEDLQGLAREVLARLSAGQRDDGFTPQALCNLLLGCAKLGYTDPALIRRLAAAAGQTARRMAPQGLTNSAWALAKMEHADQGPYAALVAATERSKEMRLAYPQNWSNLWYALALTRHRPASPRLLELTAEAAGVLRKGATAQACANLLWALANLRLYDERLVDALAGRLGELLRQDQDHGKGQELTNSVWALAVMGPDVLSRHSGLVGGLLHEAVRRWEIEAELALSHKNLRQLWQAQLELEAMGGGELRSILGAGEGLAGSLLTAVRVGAVAGARRLASLPPSPLEAELASALEQLQQRMGPGAIVSVQGRCVVEEVGRVAQAVVELADGRRVTVETVGQSQAFSSDPHRRTPVGPVELNLRQLGRAPSLATVLRVPYWEWEEAKFGGEAGQRAYLCRLLGLGAA